MPFPQGFFLSHSRGSQAAFIGEGWTVHERLQEPDAQQRTELLRTLLTTVAEVAEETLGRYREALARTTDALTGIDDVGDAITILAEQTASLATSGDSVDLAAALADWRSLDSEISRAAPRSDPAGLRIIGEASPTLSPLSPRR